MHLTMTFSTFFKKISKTRHKSEIKKYTTLYGNHKFKVNENFFFAALLYAISSFSIVKRKYMYGNIRNKDFNFIKSIAKLKTRQVHLPGLFYRHIFSLLQFYEPHCKRKTWRKQEFFVLEWAKKICCKYFAIKKIHGCH